MSRFLHTPKTPSLWLITLLTVSLIGAFEFAFALTGKYLAPHTIVDLEFIWTSTALTALLAQWGAAGQAAAYISLWVDFGFMPVYAIAFAGLTLLGARATQGRWQSAGLWLTLAPLAAALFDVVENLCLLNVLDHSANPSAMLLTLAGVSATIKFGLLAGCVGYWLGVIGRRLVKGKW